VPELEQAGTAVPEFSGFQALAKILNPDHLERYGKPLTRQIVYGWWARRSSNHFPEKVDIPSKASNGKPYLRFKTEEVISWYSQYVPGQGGRKRNDDTRAYSGGG
jgi:hypothetical protein